MADLIERDAALARIDCCLGNSLGGRKEFDSGLIQARKFVLSTPAVNRLIPCSKRLPDKDGKYLVIQNEQFDILEYNTQLKQFGYRYEDEDEPGYPYTEWAEMQNVTHWMPLPEKP